MSNQSQWKICGFVEASGEIVLLSVQASNSLAAFAQGARLKDGVSWVCAVAGDAEFEFPGDGVVDSETIIEQSDVFITDGDDEGSACAPREDILVDWVRFAQEHWDEAEFVKVNDNLRQIITLSAYAFENAGAELNLVALSYSVNEAGGKVIDFGSERLVGAKLLSNTVAVLRDGVTLEFFADNVGFKALSLRS